MAKAARSCSSGAPKWRRRARTASSPDLTIPRVWEHHGVKNCCNTTEPLETIRCNCYLLGSFTRPDVSIPARQVWLCRSIHTLGRLGTARCRLSDAELRHHVQQQCEGTQQLQAAGVARRLRGLVHAAEQHGQTLGVLRGQGLCPVFLRTHRRSERSPYRVLQLCYAAICAWLRVSPIPDEHENQLALRGCARLR